MSYNHHEIEKKWQKYWYSNNTFGASNVSEKPKYYYLIEFPYPSGSGLHVGHVRSYTALDAMARKKRMEGYNVLYPIGWDAFGLPAEQYAIKNKIHPSQAVEENVKVFKGQIKELGISFDWEREFSTTDPEYYKWTQWQFLKLYENDMAYKAVTEINWCPTCKVGLANEEAQGGECERCGTETNKRSKEQWMLKMKSYAQKLLDGLDDTEFVDRVKLAQVNWIGKSVGSTIHYDFKEIDEKLTVFTTRPDTIYGATFMVMSPEHPILKQYAEKITNINEVEEYQVQCAKKTEIERTDMTKEKTGVKIEGLTAINPITKNEVEIWISDYVLMGYGSGAIMAVPAHDERDYAFAKKYGIEIIEVIKGGNISKEAYTGNGEMINSGLLNGLDNKADSIKKMNDYLEENTLGEPTTNYKLQDWVFSRQRFWGEPVPMIHCECCGWQPVPYDQLPVTLPEVTHYEPTDTGDSPLAKIDEWVNTTCPKCGGAAKRETDTMPNWAGSNWYFLRYMDNKNDDAFVSEDALNYWGKVDYYNGGMEHAARHLLYARFWNIFLHEIGLVPNSEPFLKRVAHGMILGDNGVKMSKSKGNVVTPDDMVKKYGADALRCYEMFIGDYEKNVSWNESSLNGCKRFLDRIERLSSKVIDGDYYTNGLEVLVNQTIQKVTSDIEVMKFNTAISTLMILLNEFEKCQSVTKKDYRLILSLLNPFAPHITEELNEVYNLGPMLSESEWPKFDKSKLVEDNVQIIVQVNGKLRSRINIPRDMDKVEVEKIALAEENVVNHIGDKEIRKVIVVPNKIVNIVV